MKINVDYLNKIGACEPAIIYFEEKFGLKDVELELALNYGVKNKHYDWVRWLIRKLLKDKIKAVKLAIFSAELVLHIYEKNYLNDNRPRKAIESAKKYILNPCEKTADAAYAAANVAYATAYDTNIANASASAANAAAASASAANAAYDANASANAAYAAYAAAASAYDANAKNRVWKKIIRYLIEIL